MANEAEKKWAGNFLFSEMPHVIEKRNKENESKSQDPRWGSGWYHEAYPLNEGEEI